MNKQYNVIKIGKVNFSDSKIFSSNVMPHPGANIEVKITLLFHFSPPKLLYILALTYPAGDPSRTYSTMAHVIRAPLLAGLRKPKHAKAKVTRAMQNTWHPEPKRTDRSMPLRGGRNTSP